MDGPTFSAAWGEPLVVFPPGDWALQCDPGTVAWLTSAGLPPDAAPFLSFGPGGDQPDLPGVCVGSTGNGDPIVVTPTGEVVFVLHGDAERTTFRMAGSVEVLCALLLAFRERDAERLKALDPEAFEYWGYELQCVLEAAAPKPTRAQRQAAEEARTRANADALLAEAAALVAAGELPRAHLIYGDLLEAGIDTPELHEGLRKLYEAADKTR